jgi:hypothetical protein
MNMVINYSWIAVHEERNIQDKKLFKAAIPLSPWVYHFYICFKITTGQKIGELHTSDVRAQLFWLKFAGL